ncbi:hypothetical protein MLD38_003127 [Melastoma candidum]|uniref:Uncharacterized protein n=1 Tax=Melastoma candidum TaxID=119954 RepID=A0ACB9S3J8_9MYRT|nr:hypothetical protein MLD38_003127 [Melastoma candidum]
MLFMDVSDEPIVHSKPKPEAVMDSEGVTWEELLGSNDWEGLLDPLDHNLRKLILRCGDFCQVARDVFNNDQCSKYCGFSRYGKADFFKKAEMDNSSDYVVSSFLYASARVSRREAFFVRSKSREACDRESNWIGYIATTSDEVSLRLGRREIYIVWRGTERKYEWVDELGAMQESIETLLPPEDDGRRDSKVPKVMRGWVSIYVTDDPNSPFMKLSARAQLLMKIRELREKHADEKLSIIFCGHSLGASLAILSAFDLVANGVRDIPVAAIVTGCPRVGNRAFREKYNSYPNLKALRVTNKMDAIPHYPSWMLGYIHVGTELRIDTRKSPYLKNPKSLWDWHSWHNLQGILHVVAGWNGEKGGFELKVERSIALVNKGGDFLKDECLVPASWWVLKNKGMVRKEDGEWALEAPELEDMLVPEF